MCGFAGEFLLSGAKADLATARMMGRQVAHRGPDEESAFLSSDGRCAMAFRRLAVIDVGGSHQPMTSANGKITVAFNGEIYNFRKLREQLAAQGAGFRTAGDTEVLLHLYARHGWEMLGHLDGMFAIAIYDSARGQLFLARDRLGEKPLWYALLDDRIVFASEAKALLMHPAISKQVDTQSITSYLLIGYIPAPESIWSAIRKLPPAHFFVLGTGEKKLQRYWQPLPTDQVRRPADLLEQVRETVKSAVESRMVSDVPLGALLSGGIDSAIVVALMAKAAGRSGGVKTFTAGFDKSDFDERPAARQLANFCGTQHTELLVEPIEPTKILDRIVDMYDEPFADSSALPTYLICRAAREHVTVALAGDGGDEVFAGYGRYRAMHIASSMGGGKYLMAKIAAGLIRPWAPHDERKRSRRFLRFVDVLSYHHAMQYFKYRCLFDSSDLPRLLTEEFCSKVDTDAPEKWFCDLYEDGEFSDEVTHAQVHDLLTYLPDDLLVKTDIASMASSLELRAPLLGHDVVQMGLSLPLNMKVTSRQGKIALRQAFGNLVPADVFKRPKRGFAVPLDHWLRCDLLETMKEVLLDRSFLSMGIFRPDAIAGLINDHLSGRGDHRHRLWALLVLGKWLAKNQ